MKDGENMTRTEFEAIISRVIELTSAIPRDEPRDVGLDMLDDILFKEKSGEARAQKAYLDSLDIETLANLQAVMYCGRDGSLDVIGLRQSLAPYHLDRVVDKLLEKGEHLAHYLCAGRDAVGRQFDKLLSIPLSEANSPAQASTHRTVSSNRVTSLPPRRNVGHGTKKSDAAAPVIPGYVDPHLLGSGGNGQVFSYTSERGERVAVKVFTKHKNPKRLARFRNEVALMTRLSKESTPGVVPLIKSQTDKAPFYYVMPLGVAASSDFETTLKEGMHAISELAKTLAELHANHIFHRDLKPENILKVNSGWCFADFGLAEFPDAEQVTTEGEEIGPYYNKPPEMRRTAHTAEGGPADVYEFAKTAWMLLTGEPTGFDGQFQSDVPKLSLTRLFREDGMAAIEYLLHQATAYDPSERPSMREFADAFARWESARDDFVARTSLEWEYTIKRLFPSRAPHRAEWIERDAIARILQVICQTSSLNHAFFPGGGGNDLEDVDLLETDLLTLSVGTKHIVKPRRLELVIWPQAFEWSYFFLELSDLNPTGQGAIDSGGFIEEVVEFPDGTIRHPEILQAGGEYVGEEFIPLPAEYHRKCRILRGSMVFFGKGSTYNFTPATYDGRHQKLGRLRFYDYIERQVYRSTA